MQRLDTGSFALAGAIYGAAFMALATILALLGIPGFKPFADFVTQFYGPYGYSVSPLGIVTGSIRASLRASSISAFSPCSTIWC